MSDAGDQVGLFDSGADPVEKPTKGKRGRKKASARPVFVPTNRHNLLKFLAARMLLPVEGFDDKYYEDLLRHSPGRVPIFASGITSELAKAIAVEDNDFPVLLELDLGQLEPVAVPVIGSGRRRVRVGTTDAIGWAPAGPIPFAVVTRVHVRSMPDLEALTLNAYADVRPVPDLLAVSPELFDSMAREVEVESQLTSLPVPVLPVSLRAVDRRAGALALAALALTGANATELAEIAGSQYPTGASPGVRGFANWVMSRDSHGDDDAGEAEARTTATILETLESVDRHILWRPIEVLRTVRERLVSELRETETGNVDPVLARAEAILRSEEAFEGLKEGGWPILKALLLALMRPDPGEWDSAELAKLGADSEVRLLTGAAVGAIHGRSRLPVSVRIAALDDALAHWQCDQTRTDENPTPRLPTFGYEAGWLTLGDQRLTQATNLDARVPEVTSLPADYSERASKPPDVADIAKLLSNPTAAGIAVEVAKAHEWPDAIVTTITILEPTAQLMVRSRSGAGIVMEVPSSVVIDEQVDPFRFAELLAGSIELDSVLARIRSATRAAPE